MKIYVYGSSYKQLARLFIGEYNIKMYDGIFDDFEIIKRHCRNNGNIKFEESAVFELLENLAPHHGPIAAVQIILEMLDAQTVRDCNTIKIDNVQTDDSNDSIIEVKVPKKCHPVIDLTDDSLQVNESISVIEQTPKNCSNSNIDCDTDSNSNDANYFGGQSDNGLSDSDVSKNLDEYWNRQLNSEPMLSEILTMFEESNQSNQFESSQNNSNVPEVSEMLEENNNDPNNNLDGTIFEDELIDIGNVNNTNGLHLVNSVAENSNTDNNLKVEVFDPVPGCSKDTEERVIMRINNTQSLPNTLVKQPPSPVAGCSKDFDNSNDFELPHSNHGESIISEALCIQNLLPWASLEEIHAILEKYKDSSNRKQLALWDLVSEASDKSKTNSKRKQDSDLCTISKKCMKMEVDIDDNLEDFLDLSTNSLNQFDNVTYNESNDSMSNSEMSNEVIKQNQNGNVSVASEPSNALHLIKTEDKKKLIEVSNQLVTKENHQSQLHKTDIYPQEKIKFVNNQKLNNAALIQHNDFAKSFVNFTNPVVKKERVETVVSGSLNEHSTIQAEEIKSKEANNIIIHNLSNNEEKQCNSDLTFIKSYSNLSRFRSKRIEKEINALEHLINYDKKIGEEMSASRAETINIIKPAKLNINHKPLPLNDSARPIKKASYIRPAIFTLEDLNNDIGTKVKNEIVYKKPDQSERRSIQSAISKVVAYTQNIHDKNQPSSSNAKKDNKKLEDFVDEYMPIQSHCNYVKPVIRSNVIKCGPPKLNNTLRLVKNLTEVVPPPASKKVNNIPDATPSNPENYDQTIYNKLRSIFPDIKSSYIKEICKNPPVLIDMNNKSQAINILIDHLLKEGSNHIQPLNIDFVEPKAAATVLSMDEQYEYLLGIFPDADPTFLRKFVEENINKENVFEQFIQEKLETHNYPTKEQYLAKIKVTEQIKTYTTDFKVDKYLEIFPDPFKHFENEKRECFHHPIAMEFLKSHFNKNKVTTICRFYLMNKYNLSLTAKALTNLGYDMKSKRLSAEMPTENIPLLQEMAFIKHKQSIIGHINSRKAAEEQLFKELQEKNLLLTCQCCFNEECMPTKCVECNNNHVFCYDCLIRGTEMALAKGEAHVKCFTDCQSDFSLATLQKVLMPTTFSALLKKRQAAEVMAAEVEGLVSCPFCHFASIPPPEDKVFKCLNPECMKETCRQCKELNHVPLKCDEVIKTDKARLLIEEKMTEALLRVCYKCNRSFYKEDGCNKMTCSCGAIMCYLCNKPIKNYTHFNAQGGANINLCPLWSDSKRLNAEAVRKVAEDYKTAILKENPNLHIDTDQLMPKLPPRSKGPHDDIPNANQLPEYVQRVIGAAP